MSAPLNLSCSLSRGGRAGHQSDSHSARSQSWPRGTPPAPPPPGPSGRRCREKSLISLLRPLAWWGALIGPEADLGGDITRESRSLREETLRNWRGWGPPGGAGEKNGWVPQMGNHYGAALRRARTGGGLNSPWSALRHEGHPPVACLLQTIHLRKRKITSPTATVDSTRNRWAWPSLRSSDLGRKWDQFPDPLEPRIGPKGNSLRWEVEYNQLRSPN